MTLPSISDGYLVQCYLLDDLAVLVHAQARTGGGRARPRGAHERAGQAWLRGCQLLSLLSLLLLLLRQHSGSHTITQMRLREANVLLMRPIGACASASANSRNKLVSILVEDAVRNHAANCACSWP